MVCFNSEGDIAYFSSSTENVNSLVSRKDRYKGKDVNKLQLFTAKKDKYGYWSEYQVLPFCNKDYTYTNPVLSPDGKTMYFASNFTGSYGGLDIWRVSINNGSFGEPQNLGPSINTVFDENFPFVGDDNQTLFFASKGHEGFGGYDIFEINIKNSSAKPANLGVPFNTEKDDFAYSFYGKNEVGFLSSNREGKTNIYSFQESNEEQLLATLTETESGEVIKNASIQLLDVKNKVVKTLTTNSFGQITNVSPADTKYKLKFENPDYETFISEIQTASKGHKKLTFSINKKVKEVPKPTIYQPSNILYEFNRFDLTSESIEELDKIAILLNTTSDFKLEIIAHTDSRGPAEYNLRLSKKRAKSAFDYLVSKGVEKYKLTMTGMGESQLLVDCGENCSEEDHAKNRRSEFRVTNQENQVVAIN
jgi:outer membrane protein OmpA-like peptidoglycan-associated protein